MGLNVSNSAVIDLFLRSRDWLLRVWAAESQKSSPRLEDLLTLILGLWICKAASSDDSVQMQLLVENLASRLNSAESHQRFDPFCYDSKLLLLTHQLLLLHNRHFQGIESFAKLIGLEVAKLAEIPFRLIGETLLLSQLGLAAPPAVPLLTMQDVCVDRISLLRLERSQLVLVCANLAAASHFGLRPLRAQSRVRFMLRESLPPLLLETLRDYDLELGATIMRTMRYAGLLNNWAFRLGVLFLMNQQDTEGRFGRLSKEAIAVAESSGIPPENVTTRLYLPITVSCLWALAESLYPHFTLISSCSHGNRLCPPPEPCTPRSLTRGRHENDSL